MSLMPHQAVPVRRTPLGLRAARADHSAWVPVDAPFEDAGAGQSVFGWAIWPFEDSGAGQSLCNLMHQPFEDGAEQSNCLTSPFIPFEDGGADQSWGAGPPMDIPFEG